MYGEEGLREGERERGKSSSSNVCLPLMKGFFDVRDRGGEGEGEEEEGD